MVFDGTLKAGNTISDDAVFAKEDTGSAAEVAELGDCVCCVCCV